MTDHQGLLLFMADIDAKREDEFNRWYEEEHVPERLAIPGFLRACRYKAVVGAPRYLALYEVVSPDVFSSAEYLRYLKGPGETAGTKSILTSTTNVTRNIYMKISERRA
ncbi:MAG: hypothetical protein A3G35_09735 [candidate division NC10 bacterium RIFCSPLOWO2_12_FULL_66_18]|nr:MAG: hypothetical protein A3H39_04035 [candidate division NC10 bacterium RIFCSPLOWO2_02_FULL_66_22]OGC00995.1 MAG: hypothetical protein A3G35_09735 [candidate division NC10 bacterium RIFCSPLOWO2_12_FULL_66_18]